MVKAIPSASFVTKIVKLLSYRIIINIIQNLRTITKILVKIKLLKLFLLTKYFLHNDN